MSKPVLYSIFFILLVFAACVSIPPKHLTVSQRGSSSKVQDANDCDIDQYKNILRSNPSQKTELDSEGFRILTGTCLRHERGSMSLRTLQVINKASLTYTE